MPSKVYPISPPKIVVVAEASPEVMPSPKAQDAISATITPENVRAYVLKEAEAYGINPVDALFIVSKESQDGENMVGDHGISLGYWMFNIKANPEVSRSCALDLACSTKLAMTWILAGKIQAWSTWHYRCSWFQDAPDCP